VVYETLKICKNLKQITMKSYISILKGLLGSTALTLGLFACIGEQSDQLVIVKPAEGARVKFIHAVADGPGVGILVNNRQFSGVLTTPPTTPAALTYASAFPISDYATLDAGTAKIEVVIPASATTPQTPVISGNVPIEANKYYSIFAIGSVASANLEALVTEDNIVPTDTSKAYIRFVNTVVNATGGYDLGLGTNFPAALANVRYKQISNFVAIDPAPIGAVATAIVVRANGTTANLAPTTFTLIPIKRRFYTVFVRGRVGGTGAQAITATLYTNR
jgi:hypothetical protein